MPDTAPKLPTREELENAWWDRWWAEDFSWEGLAKKTIAFKGGLHGEKTLQEYWRRQPGKRGFVRSDDQILATGELVRDPEENLWHLAHVPLTWRDGTAAKSAWTDGRTLFLQILTTRLEMAQMTLFSEELAPAGGIDGRARLEGAIFLPGDYDFPTPGEGRALHLDAEWVWFAALKAIGRAFGPGARFDRAFISGDTHFDQTNFAERAGFIGTTFAGETRFSESSFDGMISFEDATFAEAAHFYKTTFAGGAHLDRVTFGGDAYFEHAAFNGFTYFRGARFESDCRFHRARFSKDAHFKGARFQAQMGFNEAAFEEQAFFEHILWPGSPGHWHKIFDRTMFKTFVSFRGAKRQGVHNTESFIPHAAFDGTKFERRPDFDVTSEAAASQNFEASLRGAKFVASESKPANSQDELDRLTELEGGCRVLKKAMADESDKTREHMFYRFELMARNARSDTPWQEKLASRVYEAVSDYGTSILWPWRWLLAVAGFAAVLYFYIGIWQAPEKFVPWQWLWDAFDLSLSRVFQPLTFWSASNLQDNALGMELIGNKDRGLLAFFVRFLGTVQSLVSITLLFLSALALRRRFQIN